MLFAPVTSKGITLMSFIGLGMLGLVLRETDQAETAMALPLAGIHPDPLWRCAV
jgi:hypothetical protein